MLEFQWIKFFYLWQYLLYTFHGTVQSLPACKESKIWTQFWAPSSVRSGTLVSNYWDSERHWNECKGLLLAFFPRSSRHQVGPGLIPNPFKNQDWHPIFHLTLILNESVLVSNINLTRKKLAKLSPVRVENTLGGGATVQYIAVPLGLLKIG